MWDDQLNPDYINMIKNVSEEEKEKPRIGNKENWYTGSKDYWNSQPTTVDGVLGGYGVIHETDSDTSAIMIEGTRSFISGFDQALDCGAGIGRITKTTLLPAGFKAVDLLEPAPLQLEQAKLHVPEARNFYCAGLQEFDYQTRYDALWVQWCLCYLTDSDLSEFLAKTKRDGLNRTEDGKTGLIFVKENVAGGEFILDKSDNSVMRTNKQFETIFQASGYTIMKQFIQKGMPKELHHISCFVLKPNFEKSQIQKDTD